MGELAAFICKRDSNTVTAPSLEWASMEWEQFLLWILGNSCSDWLSTSIYEILAAFGPENNSNMLPPKFWTWVLTERRQFEVFHIWQSRHRRDLRMHNCIIDRLDRPIYLISKVKHRYQINWYCKLHNIQKHIIGCWKCHFDKILLTNCKHKCLIWIYRWTRWETCWHPAQFRCIGSLPSNRSQVYGSGVLTTQTANLSNSWVWTWMRTRSDSP